MAGSVERYAKIIRCAVEVRQLRDEIRHKLAEMADLLTAKELTTRRFDRESVAGAMKLVADGEIEIKEATHVGATLLYKDVGISLHEPPDRLGSKAMEYVLSEISVADIVNAVKS